MALGGQGKDTQDGQELPEEGQGEWGVGRGGGACWLGGLIALRFFFLGFGPAEWLPSVLGLVGEGLDTGRRFCAPNVSDEQWRNPQQQVLRYSVYGSRPQSLHFPF